MKFGMDGFCPRLDKNTVVGLNPMVGDDFSEKAAAVGVASPRSCK
jgi:hypothetical protein